MRKAPAFARLGVSLLFSAALLFALIISSSATSGGLRRAGEPSGRAAAERAAAPEAAPRASRAGGLDAMRRMSWGIPAAAFQAALETIEVSPPANRANGCADPNILCLGETVTAQVSNAPLRAGFRERRILWVAPDGTSPRQADVLQDPETDTYALPVTGAFAQVGTWEVRTINNRNGGVVVKTFEVRAPTLPSVDLELTMSGPAAVSAGFGATYNLTLKNHGPDDAAGVVLVNAVPFNTTFTSATGDEDFACVTPAQGESGPIVCTGASLAAGEEVSFTFSFAVNDDVKDGTAIFNVARAGSATNESNRRNNSDHVFSTSAPAQPCELASGTCPQDITAQAATGQAGALVTFELPTAEGNCDTAAPGDEGGAVDVVSCSQAPGSFFPVGTTEVKCASPSGDACIFNVTVTPGSGSIKLNGGDPFILECRGTDVLDDNAAPRFIDPGAIAFSGAGAPLAVTVTGSADVRTPGDYIFTYTATDDSTDPATELVVTRTVRVVDTEAPVITLEGPNPMRAASCAGGFEDPGATARDACAGEVEVTSSGSVNMDVPGKYVITYTATDGTRTARVRRVVIVGVDPDEADPPTLTLNGDQAMTVECGAFTDPGATARDACGNAVPVSVQGAVNANAPGVYRLVYTATAAGQTSEVSRTVEVVDTAAPVLTLNPGPSTVECHSAYTDPGATANDACEGARPVTVSGAVDPNVPGTYTVTYTATDSDGRSASATRTVTVVDTTAPVITLAAGASITHECHTPFADPGATANDACDAGVPVSASGSVNVDVPGTYTLSYTASDDSGNTTTVNRTVQVVDTTPPVISCPADIVVTLPLNTTDVSMPVSFGAPVASDTCDSTASVATSHASGSVFGVGTTVVTATATDDAGNSSSCSFKVTVLYNFTGFFSPVSNTVSNQVNAGRTIPVKFSLSGNKGLSIFDAGSPFTRQVPCSSEAVNDMTPVETTGNSSLSYSPDQYHFNWKTDTSWAGTCRDLVVKLNDGSEHTARFKFK